MTVIQLGIFDDHPIVSNGIVNFLTAFPDQVSILFSAHTAENFLKHIAEKKTDVLVIDVVAPDVIGLDLFTSILKINSNAKIIAYTSLNSVLLVENLLNLGVKGFVNKNQAPADLLTAIKDVHFDLIAVPEKYAFLTAKFREAENHALTKREIEIIQLIASECTTQEMATKLNVSTKTIENHKLAIFKKLEVKNSAGLMLAATRLGYIS
jgi:DNA-binding NarL/FixJ family response regulator